MKPSIVTKLDHLSERLVEINQLLMQEGSTANMDNYRKLNREHAELTPVVELYHRYQQALLDISSAQEMMSDPDMKEFAQEEINNAKTMAKPAPLPTCRISSTGSRETTANATAPDESSTPIRFHMPDQTTAMCGSSECV